MKNIKKLAWLILLTAQTAYGQATLTPNVGLQVPAYQQTNWQVPIDYDLNVLDKLLGGYTMLPVGTSTPTIQLYTSYVTANTVSTSITNFLGGYPGQTINVICGSGDSSTSISSGATISLAASWSCPSGKSLTLILVSGVWNEVSRAGGGSGGGSGGGTNVQTASYLALTGDNGKNIAFNNSGAVTLTLPATPPTANWYIGTQEVGAGGLTVSPNGHNLDGVSSSLSLVQGQGILIFTDGSNYWTMRGGNGGTNAILATDNIFSNNNRFKGPIPNRDFTAYMPATGCSSNIATDPPATGTISSGFSTLTVSAASDFKNGCGIAVTGAGPTSTITMASTATGSVTRCANPPGCSTTTGTQVLFTVGSGSIPIVAFQNGGAGGTWGGVIVISGCSDSNLNATTTGWIEDFNSPVTQFTYDTVGTSSTTATGCTATFFAGWPHGVTGSTTYNYKIAPVDSLGGVGPAIGPITITTGNATLSTHNFNFLSFQNAPGTRMFVVYSDKGLGGAYSCINMAYSRGYSDYGLYLPACPPYVPSTPPASNTAQTLNTTIVSGGGTTSLTLAATASNNATTQPVYDDVSSFLASCITDSQADQVNSPSFHQAGGAGCVIPYGRWPIAADMPTDTIDGYAGGGTRITVEGVLYLQTWPWLVGRSYSIVGNGQSGGSFNGMTSSTVLVQRSNHMPSGMIIHGSAVEVSGLNLYSMLGDGLMFTEDPSNGGNASGTLFQNVATSVDSTGTGVPIHIDGNYLFGNFININAIPRASSSAFPAVVLFDSTAYGSNSWCCTYFTGLYSQYHGIYFQQPGGGNAGVGANVYVSGWESEDRGTYTTCAVICWDSGYTGQVPGGPAQGPNIPGLYVYGIDNADSSNKVGVQLLGTATPSNAGSISFYGPDSFNYLVNCDASSTRCPGGPTIHSDQVEQPAEASVYTGPQTAGGYQQALPFWINNNTSGKNVFSILVPPPNNLTLTGGSAGTLADGHYCIRMVALDNQATPGLTQASQEKCVTLSTGGSGSVTVQWQMQGGTAHNQASNFRMYYSYNSGADPNYSEANYFLTNATLNTYPTYSYAFNSTTSAVSGSPPLVSNAQYSWISNIAGVPSCIACDNHGYSASVYQVGVGEPSPPTGDKLAVKGGAIDAETTGYLLNGVLLASTTAPTISAHFNTSGDSISSSNGSATFRVTVGTGSATSTGTVALPTAPTGWNCSANNLNRADLIQQTGGSATTAVFTNYGLTIGTPVNFTNSDVLAMTCLPN